MVLTHEQFNKLVEPYLTGDFTAFLKQSCSPDVVFILGSGNPLHEFSGTYKGFEAANRMITEGLSGKEVENGEMQCELRKVVIEGDQAAAQWHLRGVAKRNKKPFVLSNSWHITVKDGKVVEWTDHLDTLTVGKVTGLHELDPELK